jgi:predicted metal-dependent hydrolase
MRLFLLVLSLFILYLCYIIKVTSNNNKSNKENYTSKKNSKTINFLKKKTRKLIIRLKRSEFKDKKEVKRLINNWSGVIRQLKVKYKSESIAYSVNKGERIHICLTDPNTGELIKDKNTMFFVLLHELAHVMTKEYSHNQNFWNNFRFLLRFSIKEGMYRYVNYSEQAVTFCGKYINHNPCQNESCD